ncbi:hypothetical protein Ddye_013862 [Dipteronia dyeriana]|uniref:Glycosyltransferase n=1 Tax=Dipteronia dyeriana TaxID=168575 RepID=A0AAD9X797_9ROSI|nr:hypothetical protein Ddye_013862 [Dipteronia dyeriana]
MESIVLYPAPDRGHLISTVELAKLILSQKPSLTIHIIVINPPIKLGSTAPYISAVSATVPSIKFHHLPTVSMDPNSYPNSLAIMFDHFRLVNPHVADLLRSLYRDFTVRCLIIDLFCFPALEIASELNIPAYYFFTSGASCLAVFLHLPNLYETTSQNFNDLHTTFLNLPDFPPIPLSHMPVPILFRNNPECLYFIECAANLKKSAGIIVNSFESLEQKAVKLLSSSSSREGFCIPDSTVPPVYCIGPLTTTTSQTGANMHECMTWLDTQPSRSVVFLCFGSMGLLSKQQLQEIAFGLERSQQRFLWVVRNPPSDNQSKDPMNQPDPDLDLVLPSGFLDRTSSRGLVVKSWAPQVTVLSHISIGGFVTHCGWNSVLESILAGVPMVAWPLYAEQKLNKAFLVEELKLALPMNSEPERGELVSAAEVEKRVIELMDSEEGDSVRKRVVKKRDEAIAALSHGGSSRVALAKLAESWVRN